MSYELPTKRHSLSHILAQAVKSIYPDAKLAIGPDIEHGFYYDFDFGEVEFKEENLKEIEKKMKNIIKQNQIFENYRLPVDEAIRILNDSGEIYKVEMAEDLKAGGETEISFYKNMTQQGIQTFVDMCRGPHVGKSLDIDESSFKLDKIAGAYWKGDSNNKMLTRIYAFAFENREELDAYLKQLEEAKRRDHRIIGDKMKLFTISKLVGAGLPLLQPNGMVIRKEIEDYLWELHKNKGYDRVWTPHLAKEDLYITSGHAEKFGDELFRVKGADDSFFLKPMNCPHHMQIFADNQFSYRDMPIRYFEPATVYRDEKSGQLSGLTRVRSITQDDGHLFCRVGQISDEVGTIVSIIKEFYVTMGMIEGYWVRLSVRGPEGKYMGSDEAWEKAEGALTAAAEKYNLPYRIGIDEAAFYGPKLDFIFKDAIGREWQLATIQCDFQLPERFDLSYVNEAGEKERPVVIHRAISGSLERFMGVMIEHFAGIFPLWLAPKQVIIVPVSDIFNDYGQEICKKLKESSIRATVDNTSDSLNKKVRNAEMSKIPYILIVGEQEQNDKTVSVRNYKTKEQNVAKIEDFISDISEEIKTKKI
ncbi:MAG: threonine--tRNA ligase [Candidatus Gracilibacteria bacterium]|nr:threonine--tRNA ligase [Candidatus Gracilibacteria bacterium]